MAVFVDALPAIEAAMRDLAEGQLIQTEDLNLLQLMGAIEIMDDRTDSWLQTPAEKESTITRFDPQFDISARETLWIIDELFRLEMTFHDGHPLGSTLFRCQYLRPARLVELCSASKSPTTMNGQESGWRRIVLRALLLGVIKTVEITWEELSKAQVYENEDVQLSMAGLTFPSLLAACFPIAPTPTRIFRSDDPPADRAVSVDDVLAALMEATAWISENCADDDELAVAIKDRLSMRSELIYATAFLSSPPHTTPAQLSHHLSNVSLYAGAITSTPLSTSFEPTPILEAIFKRGYETPLASMQPIRVMDPISLEDSWTGLEEWIDSLKAAVGVWDDWESGGGWPNLREYFVSLSRSSMPPYPRSAHQTLLSHNKVIFGEQPASALAVSLFSSTLSIPQSFWATLIPIRDKETTFDSPARKVLGWLDKVGAVLVTTLATSCQNPGRAGRLVMKGLSGLSNLIVDLEKILPLLQTLLPSLKLDPSSNLPSLLAQLHLPLSALLLSQILETLLAGVKLSLYSTDELLRIYWVSGNVARELESVWLDLFAAGLDGEDSKVEGDDEGSKSGYVESKMIESAALAKLCEASFMMTVLYPSAPPKLATPFLSYDSPSTLDRAKHERRFEWIAGRFGRTEAVLEELTKYDSMMEEKGLILEDREQAIEVVRDLYRNTILLLTALGGIDDDRNGHALDSVANGSWVEQLFSGAEVTLKGLEDPRTTKETKEGAGSIVALEGKMVDPIGKRWFPYWSVAA